MGEGFNMVFKVRGQDLLRVRDLVDKLARVDFDTVNWDQIFFWVLEVASQIYLRMKRLSSMSLLPRHDSRTCGSDLGIREIRIWRSAVLKGAFGWYQLQVIAHFGECYFSTVVWMNPRLEGFKQSFSVSSGPQLFQGFLKETDCIVTESFRLFCRNSMTACRQAAGSRPDWVHSW